MDGLIDLLRSTSIYYYSFPKYDSNVTWTLISSMVTSELHKGHFSPASKSLKKITIKNRKKKTIKHRYYMKFLIIVLESPLTYCLFEQRRLGIYNQEIIVFICSPYEVRSYGWKLAVRTYSKVFFHNMLSL